MLFSVLIEELNDWIYWWTCFDVLDVFLDCCWIQRMFMNRFCFVFLHFVDLWYIRCYFRVFSLYIKSMLGFVWLSFCYYFNCVSKCVCMPMLHACICILYVWAHMLMPRNPNLGFLLFYLFCFVSILFLGLVKFSFHMFSFKVSRIISFTCLIVRLMIRRIRPA